MVVAGLFIGNQGTTLAMSETTRLHVETFWDLVDEILNSVLFLLIGLKIVFLLQDSTYDFSYSLLLTLFAAVTLLAVVARYVSIALPMRIKAPNSEVSPGAVPIRLGGYSRWCRWLWLCTRRNPVRARCFSS